MMRAEDGRLAAAVDGQTPAAGEKNLEDRGRSGPELKDHGRQEREMRKPGGRLRILDRR